MALISTQSGLRRIVFRTLGLLIALVLALPAGEALLRGAIPPTKDYSVLLPNIQAVFIPAPGVMPGVEGPNHYRVNRRGIRGPDFGPDDIQYRILAIGGSTTECLYLDESEVWTHLLSQELDTTSDGRRVWVGNVGRSGLNARDHAVEVKHLPRQYPRLDTILVLAGVNDLTLALMEGNHYRVPPPITEPEAEQKQIRKAFVVTPGRIHDPQTDYWLSEGSPWYKRSATWQMLKRARMTLTSLAGGNPHVQDSHGNVYAQWRAHRRSASRIIDVLPDLRPALEEYKRNIHAIIDAALSQSISVVFASQPSLWRGNLTAAEEALLWLGGVGDFQTEPNAAYYSSRALSEAMSQYNQALREACLSRGVKFIDLASSVGATTDNFFDDVHFTEKGSRMVADAIGRSLKEWHPFDRGVSQ